MAGQPYIALPQPGPPPPLGIIIDATTLTSGNYTTAELYTLRSKYRSLLRAAQDEADRVEYQFGLGENIFGIDPTFDQATIDRVHTYINHVRAQVATLLAQLQEIDEAISILQERARALIPQDFSWPSFPPGSSGGTGPQFTAWRDPSL